MIKKLSNAYAPSGREEEVRKILIDELSDFYKDIKVDNLGNLIIHKPGKIKTIALTAPMDEVGFLVTHVTDENSVITSSIGSVNTKALHNILTNTDKSDLFISKESVEKTDEIAKVSNLEFQLLSNCKGNKLDSSFLSNTLVFDNNYKENNEFITGKALERSVSCAILCDIARNITDSLYEYYFVFTAQNYCDRKGSLVALSGLNVDELYNIFGVNENVYNIKSKKGPVVVVRDKMLISSPELIDKFEKYTPKQLLVTSDLICEGGYFQKQSTVQNVISIGIPIKYLYCPNEVVCLDDVKQTFKMIKEIVLP